MNRRSVRQPQQPDPRGSRWLGFGLFWLMLVGGGLVSGILASVVSTLFPYGAAGPVLALAGLLPWIAPLVLAIWYVNKGKTRTAQASRWVPQPARSRPAAGRRLFRHPRARRFRQLALSRIRRREPFDLSRTRRKLPSTVGVEADQSRSRTR